MENLKILQPHKTKTWIILNANPALTTKLQLLNNCMQVYKKKKKKAVNCLDYEL